MLWLPIYHQSCLSGSCCVLLQEVDALLSENEMLQGKLHSQEEDFRLQNSTLMAELSKVCAPSVASAFKSSSPSNSVLFLQLCTQIEQLEQENRSMKEGGGAAASDPPANSASCPADGELLRLQAENAALQKKLKGGLMEGSGGDGRFRRCGRSLSRVRSSAPKSSPNLSELLFLCSSSGELRQGAAEAGCLPRQPESYHGDGRVG